MTSTINVETPKLVDLQREVEINRFSTQTLIGFGGCSDTESCAFGY